MKYAIVQPHLQSVEIKDFKLFSDAERSAGLDPGAVDHGAVDHGVIQRGLGIVVYEYGLFQSPDATFYFSIGRQLYAGNAVIYAYDERGVTVDIDQNYIHIQSFVNFYPNADAVEFAISINRVRRPKITVDGIVLWSWPESMPEFMKS